MTELRMSIRDFGLNPPSADERMVVAYKPTGTGFTSVSAFPGGIVYDEPDATGYLQTDVAPTLSMFPHVWIEPEFRFYRRDPLDADKWILIRTAAVDAQLHVPADGGPYNVGDLIKAPPPPASISYGVGAPDDDVDNTLYVDNSGMTAKLWMPEGTVGLG